MTRILAAAILLALTASASLAEGPISGARQLTFEGARSGEGYFSADGSAMIFQSEREPGNPFYQMYRMDLETGDVRRLSPGHGKTTCGWLHPDGTRALYASTQQDPEAWAKMVAENAFRESGQTRRYAWDYDPAYDITEIDLETGAYRALAPAEGYDAEGAYSPDGTQIVFASNRHAFAGDLSEEARAQLEHDPSFFMDIYVMNGDGTDLRRLTDAPGYDGGPFWSADGTRITWRRFSADGARAEIFTMASDGTDERQITHLGAMSWAPFFHPSGEYLVFASNLEGFANFELYMVDAEGRREPVRVTEREGFDGLATFHPSGDRISWTSNATPERQSQIFLADWDHAGALALLDGAPLRQAATRPRMEATQAAIDPADTRLHVEALASDEMAGRLTGTPGEAAAIAYISAAFEAIGLEPAGEHGDEDGGDDGGEDGGYTQAFDFPAGVSLGEGNRLEIGAGGETLTPGLDTGWRPYPFSARGEAEAGEVVFLGYGIVAPEGAEGPAINSYEGADVEDKWVLLWRGRPTGLSPARATEIARFSQSRYRAAIAKARGARGVIFAPPPRVSLASALPRLGRGTGAGHAGLPVVAVDRATAERMLAPLADDLEAITETVEEGGAAPHLLEGVTAAAAVALEVETRTGRNVLGRLDLDGLPADQGLPPLAIGAHLDHLGRGEGPGSLARPEEAGEIHNGADDNASGVAALLEVAQNLAARHADGRLEGARDILFTAWSGEELGLIGVTHFVEARAEAEGAEDLADSISAYINLDMVGRLRERVVASGTASSPIWEREIERRNAVIGLPIVTSGDPYLPTDATALYLAKVPILALFTGAHPDYHTPRDDAELINHQGLAEIARFVALVARGLATEAAEPAYVEVARPQGQGRRRMSRVFLGTIPDYAQDGTSGVAISGVVAGGPAEEAGLRGGDVIVRLAGTELANIYDLVGALDGLTPGEPVEIVVMREAGRVALEIEPGLRQ